MSMQTDVNVKKARTQICVCVKRTGTYVTRYSIAGSVACGRPKVGIELPNGEAGRLGGADSS